MPDASKLAELAAKYHLHNKCVEAAQKGLTPKEADIRTGKDCGDCGVAVWPWERVCKTCGKERNASSRDHGVMLGHTTRGEP